MGLPARSAEGCASHQFSLRKSTVSSRPMSGAGVMFYEFAGTLRRRDE
jgi:hypothetical protein